MPSWHWGGNPHKLLSEADYHFRKDGNESFVVQTNESYYRRQPDLVRLQTIARPGDASPRWSELAGLKEQVELTLPHQLKEAVEKRQLKAEQTGELLDVFNHQRLLLFALPIEDLPEQSRYFVEFLNSVQFTGDPTDGPFRNSSVHLIGVDPVLNHRLKIASVWLRIEQDIRLGQGDISHIRTASTNDEHVFASSAGLYDGTIVLDAYISPMLAAGSPGIWSVNVPRTFGSLLFNLGTFLPGTGGDAAEMLQLITTPGARDVVRFPRLSASACQEALEWWTGCLNALFGVLSDLSSFTDSTGAYRAAKHLESLLTVEQIFRRTTSMLVAHRDTNARRALLFNILDSLERVRGVSLLNMCTYSHAAKVLRSLESSMSAEAAEILLPR